jgi:hypothetical protein
LVKTLVIALAIDIGFAIAESLFKRVYQLVK